jgi:hypothetical protein
MESSGEQDEESLSNNLSSAMAASTSAIRGTMSYPPH